MLILGPWLWYSDVDDGQSVLGGYWAPPGDGTPNLRGSLELAPAAVIARSAPGQPRQLGLFDVESFPLGTGSTYYPVGGGDPRDERPDGKTLDAFESLCGHRPQGDTIAELLVDLLTRGSDPRQLEGPWLLVPTIRRSLELWLSNRRIWSRRHVWGTDVGYDALLQDLLRGQVAERRKQTEAGLACCARGLVDFDADRKFVDWLAEKYGCFQPQAKADFCELVGFDKPLVPHETNLADNFNRSNNADLSAGGPYTWTDVVGNLTVAGNQASGSGNGVVDRSRLESDLSGADHFCQVTCNSVSASSVRFGGVICRYDSAADSGYALRLLGNSGGATTAQDRILRLASIVTGSLTQLGTGTTQNSTLPATVKLEVSGTNQNLYYNGVLVETVSNGAVTSGTRVGLTAQGGSNSTLLDDLDAADLAAGQPTIRRYGKIPHARPWPGNVSVW